MSNMISRSAEVSPCRQYRWLLTRMFLTGHGVVTLIMLNPSTADGLVDDATLRRLIAFSQAWGYRELRVVNLFAWRASKPEDMLKQLDPVGPGGDEWILRGIDGADLVVCAWGAHAHPLVRRRADHVRSLLVTRDVALHHLGLSQAGQPRHPLYLTRETVPKRWC